MVDKLERVGSGLKGVTDLRAAVGALIFMFLLGTGAGGGGATIFKLPERVAAVEVAMAAMDDHVASIDSTVQAEAVKADRYRCMAEKFFTGQEIGPSTCEPEGE